MERTKVTEVQALADTGATLTVIPEKLAQELELGECSDLSLRGTRVPKQSQTGAGKVELKRCSAETLALSLDPLTGELKEEMLLLY